MQRLDGRYARRFGGCFRRERHGALAASCRSPMAQHACRNVGVQHSAPCRRTRFRICGKHRVLSSKTWQEPYARSSLARSCPPFGGAAQLDGEGGGTCTGSVGSDAWAGSSSASRRKIGSIVGAVTSRTTSCWWHERLMAFQGCLVGGTRATGTSRRSPPSRTSTPPQQPNRAMAPPPRGQRGSRSVCARVRAHTAPAAQLHPSSRGASQARLRGAGKMSP